MSSRFHITMLAVGLSLTAAGVSHAQSGTRHATTPAEQSSEARPPAEGSAPKPESRGAVHPNAESVQPLAVGESVPTVSGLKNARGQNVNLANATRGNTTVVVFYRGGWCPYCSTHLRELATVQPHLAANDIRMIAVSPDSPSTLAGYEEERSLPYTLLSDSTHAAAKAFGIAFAVDAETRAMLDGHGIDLVAASGNADEVILPVPAVFVIGPDNKITFSHANADYTQRLSGEDVLKALGLQADSPGSAPKEPGSEPKDEPGSEPKEPGSEPKDEPGSETRAPQGSGYR